MKPNAELAFVNPHLALSVRAFAVKDGLSQPFDCSVTAGSTAADLDLEQVVGHPAALRIATGNPEQPYAVWSGLVSEMEQVAIEESGLSIYALRIVPMLWRCKQRRNHRVFQHLSTPEIVRDLLAEWGIACVFRLDEKRFPRHEYRVQFGETDFAFLSRLLEEDGISYLLEQVDPSGNEKDETEPKEEQELPSMQLVLTESPAQTGKRFEASFPYKGHTDDVDGDIPFVTKVRLGRSVRPGRFTVGAYDYRSSPELRLLAEARAGYELEERYEHYHYIPGAFLAEPRPEQPQEGAPEDRSRGPGAQVDEDLGKRQALIGLERMRSRQRQLVMTTNQLILAPGAIFTLEGHPRPDLTKETGLLAVSRRIEGEHDDEWHLELSAVFSADPFRPERQTPKPRVMGVQSALVVGPDGEEIYCDELGRVRVQFFWDRYGQRDQNSSCWIRASQGWAGSGYGMHAIPRVGNEVLVDFIEGDPDQPIIVGRAHHRGAIPPDQLPRDKTSTSWRSSSTPGGEGYNEISMRDARGEERLLFRAQKDLEKVVLNNEVAAVGADLTTTVRGSESRKVGRNQEIHVSADRKVQVDGNFAMRAERGLQTQAGRTTGLSCVDGKLILTNGQASIVFDGPNVYVDAASNLRLSAGRLASLNGKQVNIDGRPEVYINSGAFVGPDVQQLPTSTHAGEGGTPSHGQTGTSTHVGQAGPHAPGGMNEAEFDGKGHLLDLINQQLGTKLKWPKAVKLPPEWDDQLERLGRVTFKGGVVRGKLMDPETWQDMKTRLARRIEGEKQRLQILGRDLQGMLHGQAQHMGDALTRLQDRLAVERGNLAGLRTDLGDVFSGKYGNFLESAKALGEIGKDQWGNIMALKDDLKAMLDHEMAAFQQFKEQWEQWGDGVKGVVEDFKALIDDPKDAALDIVFGEDKELAGDIADLADELGYGEEVSDFLGLDDGVSEAGEGLAEGATDAAEGLPNHPSSFDPNSPMKWDVAKKLPKNMTYKPNPKVLGLGKKLPSNMTYKPKLGFGPKGLSQGIEAPSGRGAGQMSQLSGEGPSGLRGQLGSESQMAGKGLGGKGLAQKAAGAADTEALGKGVGGQGLAQAAAGAPATEAAGRMGAGNGAEALSAGSNHADFVSQRGGLAATDVAGSVSQEGPAVLQSPSDGQILVVPNDGAGAVDPAKLQGMMVDAQMQGQPVDGAIASALEDQGYSVYKRGWGDWMGPFVEAGKGAATA